MVNTNKTTALITIGLIIIFTAVSVWFYRKYVVPSLDEDSYLENNEFTKGDPSNESVVMYFFHTEWCPHCKKAMPIWQEFKENVGNFYKNHPIEFMEIDCDKNKEMADQFNVSSYPTIKLVFRGKTYEYDARPGVATLHKFLETSVR
jgi:thiol-disulfide isomerase/thioredoxin